MNSENLRDYTKSNEDMFSKKDIESIIKDCLISEDKDNASYSKNDLFDIGSKFGINPDTIKRILDKRSQKVDEIDSRKERARTLMHSAINHGGKFLILAVFLFLLNAVVSSYWWCVFPILGIGLGTTFKIWEEFEAALQPISTKS